MDMVIALAPLIILELALVTGALVDIVRRPTVTGGKKLPWVLLIVLVGTVGPIIYFIFGRKEGD